MFFWAWCKHKPYLQSLLETKRNWVLLQDWHHQSWYRYIWSMTAHSKHGKLIPESKFVNQQIDERELKFKMSYRVDNPFILRTRYYSWVPNKRVYSIIIFGFFPHPVFGHVISYFPPYLFIWPYSFCFSTLLLYLALFFMKFT